MDVHLPKPLHGWRAFAGEVGVIVLGVLIALAAQQLVESFDWREKVRRAEAAMRLELAEDDGPEAYGRFAIGACLNQQITRIYDGAGHVPPNQLRQWIAAYAPPFRTWDSEAWKAIVASDVGSHVGPDRLVEWSSMYRIMPSMNDHNEREAQLVTELHDVVPPTGEITAEDVAMVRRTAGQLKMLNRRLVRGSELMLARLKNSGTTVRMPIQRELLSQGRAIYGGCVRAPDLNAVPEAQQLYTNLRAGSVN